MNDNVTMTLKDLLRIRQTLVRLLNAELPEKVSYRIIRFTKAVDKDLEALNESRNRVIKKHGSPAGDGTYVVKDAQREAFDAELESVLAEEVTLPVVKIKLSEISGARIVTVDATNGTQQVNKLTPYDIANLDFMLIDDSEEANKGTK